MNGFYFVPASMAAGALVVLYGMARRALGSIR